MALKIALDTNRYVDLARQDPVAVATIRAASEIHVPFVVVAELRSGFRRGAQAAENERVLTTFLQAERVRVLLPDELTTHHYAEIHVELWRAGRPIPTNDVWVAALALQHGLVLFTRDRHFEHVPRLARL